jgi:glyoxylase-like metal-dependent hydrolase (beta-lactamase superfamily II)
MKRQIVLGTLFAAGVLTISVAATQAPTGGGQPAARVVEVEKLRDNLYVMRGGGGNSAVFITATGVVVVDTKNPGWGQPLLEKIKTVTDRPVTMIINTHTHGDHVSGNVEFPATVEVVTHENTAKNMEAMRTATGITPAADAPVNIFKENGGRGLPKKTFTDTLTLGSGDDRIELYYYGRGHTNGDAFVVFPALRVMHAGDIFSGKNIPLLDANNGGSGIEIGRTLARAADTKNVEQIITGHSTVMTVADLREYAAFNNEFAAVVQAAKNACRTPDDVAGSWTIPAKYTGYSAPAPARLRANVQVVWDEVSSGSAAAGQAKSSKIWLCRDAEFEESLRTSDIERTTPIKTGVLGHLRAYFKPGGLAASAVIRRIQPGKQDGFFESYKSEIAAYKLDRMLDLNMVPPTVERRYDNRQASVQLWVENAIMLLEANKKGLRDPNAARWNQNLHRAMVFDNLVGNIDPNEGNWLFDAAWNFFKVDCTRCFTDSPKVAHDIKKMGRIDRPFFERLKALDRDAVRKEIGEYLTENNALAAVFRRRDSIVKDLEALAKQRGEAQVFEPWLGQGQ